LLLMLILGAGATLMGAYSGNQRVAREREAMQTLAEAQQALIGFAIVHGRLPRPAQSAASGVELSTPCDSEQQCTGFVPWATLSLRPAYARGQPLRYSVTPAFAVDGATLSTAVATKTISSRDGGRLVYRRGDAHCARTAQCLPAVLIASGKFQGAPGGEGSDQAINARASVHFIQRSYTDDERVAGAAFDDILAWVPYTDLRLRLVSAGSWQ
jgi:type II secretory pathway pseudopilin PulG